MGRFSPLLGWLREKVHRHGRKFPPRVLVERATGRGLDVAPYAAYLKHKFGEIYNI
jgi:carboxypeptidase Taq